MCTFNEVHVVKFLGFLMLRHSVTRTASALLFLFVAPLAVAQDVSLVGGTPAVQSFDSLAASGTGTALPGGWYFAEAGTNANTSYTAGDGSANQGDTYSFGATSSSDRALGALRSGNVSTFVGARLRNDTGNTLSQIDVAYTGEQWRRGGSTSADRLDFQYSLNATSVGDAAATWVDVDTLDFNSPNTAAAAGPLDGNASANRSAISAPISGLSLAPSATIWVRWSDLDVPSSDDGLAIDDASFAVDGTPPVDVAPTVTSTTPASNAANVALAAVLAITFSEPVDTTGAWYAIQCANSGTHMATVAGGPSTFTLTPSTAFAANESCTWTIVAADITDRDGTPDHLASDYVVQFTTVDPATQPPGVVATQPVNGAANVPAASDIRVTFSEAVTTTSAFALSCNSTSIQLDETGSGATRTLTPFTTLPAGGTCVFTITASGVRDADNIALPADVTIAFGVASGTVGGYYDQVNTSSPEQLRCSLHQTIKGHTKYPYEWVNLEIADEAPANVCAAGEASSRDYVLDIYRNRCYRKITDRSGASDGAHYNREHVWPRSLGFNTGNSAQNDQLAAHNDLHMLHLSAADWNGQRGNKPFANCTTGCTALGTDANNGAGGSGPRGNSNWVKSPDGNMGSFEVWDRLKGDMARTLFYMAIRYEGIASEDAHDGNLPDLELTDNRSLIVITPNTAAKAYMGLLTDLLAWNLQDPPDALEVARNDTVQAFQGNRNPFVDHPEWATRALFESSEPATCELAQPDDTIFKNGFDAAP